MSDDDKLHVEAAEEQTAADTGVNLRYKDKKDVLRGGALGASIGLAVIVPGVSGSVVAIIFGLYEKLLYAFGNLTKRFGACVRFLLPVAAGAVIGLVVGFFGVQALLDLIPFIVVALFAGLMLGAYPSVIDNIKGEKITPLRALLFAAGLALPAGVSALSVFAPSELLPLDGLAPYHYVLFVVIGYAVAVTQLVPGLSATALLMTAGCFTSLVESVSLTYWRENPAVFGVYACLAVGFIAGLLTVSKLLTVILGRCRAPAFYAISGLSLGSVITMFFNAEVMEIYAGWQDGGMAVDIAVGAALFIVGAAAAYLFVRYERRHKKV